MHCKKLTIYKSCLSNKKVKLDLFACTAYCSCTYLCTCVEQWRLTWSKTMGRINTTKLIFRLFHAQVRSYQIRIKITPQTHIRKFEILEISLWIKFQSALFPLDWCDTHFRTEKKSESLWFCWYCLRNEGFPIFGYEFGEWFSFHSSKKSPVLLKSQ